MSEIEKQAGEWGDSWIWCAFEPRLKVLVSFVVGKRTLENAIKLVTEVKQRSDGFIPLFTSDELSHYETALKAVYVTQEVPACSGEGSPPEQPVTTPDPALDYAQVVKTREKGKIVKIETRVVLGDTERINQRLEASPVSNRINTSFVERNNGTLRQDCRRLTRKTYCFSKRTDMLTGHLNIISATYHFCRCHQGLKVLLPLPVGRKKWHHRTPSMAAGIVDHKLTVMELLRYPIDN